jgi:hypothetical protein
MHLVFEALQHPLTDEIDEGQGQQHRQQAGHHDAVEQAGHLELKLGFTPRQGGFFHPGETRHFGADRVHQAYALATACGLQRARQVAAATRLDDARHETQFGVDQRHQGIEVTVGFAHGGEFA